MPALVLYVRLHDGRYHGEGDWPPSPARLFQALVAGAGISGPLKPSDKEALEWLEKLPPPIIAAPCAQKAERGVTFYMPNNDSDAIGGDPLKISKIRTATKVFRPWFFDAAIPFVYVWRFDGNEDNKNKGDQVCSLAKRLYQLGRGIDMAWAWGEILDENDLEQVLAGHPGRVFRPSAGKSAIVLRCPGEGSLKSLEQRYKAFGNRFYRVKEGKSERAVHRRPPIPVFQAIPYDSPPARRVYELRSPTDMGTFAPWPLTGATSLVIQLRDIALDRLQKALPKQEDDIKRALVGRKPDGTNAIPPEDRVRIIPLPSIGHVHADRGIRRVLVEIPPTCPLRADDVHWAFSGLELKTGAGEINAILTPADPADAEGFLRHYGVTDDGHRRDWCVWRTVTPAVLPEQARRRRIDPARRLEEEKTGKRSREILQAAVAVRQALRHAGVRTAVEAIRLQREPFEGKGACVEPFAEGTRFDKHRLWHVEITFAEPMFGPLIIGDGRFLGLGVMAPVR